MPAVAPKVAPMRRTWVHGAADFAFCRDPNASRGSTNRRRAQKEASAPDAGRRFCFPRRNLLQPTCGLLVRRSNAFRGTPRDPVAEEAPSLRRPLAVNV